MQYMHWSDLFKLQGEEIQEELAKADKRCVGTHIIKK